MANPHAEWFAALAHGSVTPEPEIRWGVGGHIVYLPIDGPFATYKAAEIACERYRRQIADLIADAPAAVDVAHVED